MLELIDTGSVDVSTSGLRHGCGVFETIRVIDGKPLRLGLHLERMRAGAAFFAIGDIPACDAVSAFLACSGRIPPGAAGAEGSLRLYAFDGRIAVSYTPGLPAMPNPAGAAVSETIVRYSKSPLCRFKTMSYLENLLLVREAETRGCFDMLALNERGTISDGGRTSLFMVLGGTLYTPPTSDGALPGIARRALLKSGLAQERSLSPADLHACTAALLTNALRLAIPLHYLCDRPMDTRHQAIAQAVEILQKNTRVLTAR